MHRPEHWDEAIEVVHSAVLTREDVVDVVVLPPAFRGRVPPVMPLLDVRTAFLSTPWDTITDGDFRKPGRRRRDGSPVRGSSTVGYALPIVFRTSGDDGGFGDGWERLGDIAEPEAEFWRAVRRFNNGASTPRTVAVWMHVDLASGIGGQLLAYRDAYLGRHSEAR